MTLLFVVQSHKSPKQIGRLADIILRGCTDAFLIVSHDARSAPLDRSLFANASRVHVLSGRGGRGDFLILDGYLAALRFARDEGLSYDWVTNLSGQDYPVASLKGFEQDLANLDSDGYLHYFDVLANDPSQSAPMDWPPDHGRSRYYFQYTKLKDSLALWERVLLAAPRLLFDRLPFGLRISTAFGLMIGHYARDNPFRPDFVAYAGSYWHTIRRSCAEYLLEFHDNNPVEMAFFRNVLVPDEFFAQTVLVNQKRFRFTSNNRRYYDMRNSRRGHPKTLTAHDWQDFTGGDHVFARKFEESAGEALFESLDRLALAPAEAGQAGLSD